jgi:protein-S-isoprenylcysteine O-methyltransferase Ste14
MVTCGVPPIVSWLTQLAGVPAIAYGTYLVLSSVWQLREHNSPYIIPSLDNKLVTDGVYRYAKHPMYGGLIVSSVGVAIYTNSVEKLILAAMLAYVLVSPQKRQFQHRAQRCGYCVIAWDLLLVFLYVYVQNIVAVREEALLKITHPQVKQFSGGDVHRTSDK